MATAKKCDRCGRYYEGNRNYVYTDENDVKHIINSFRIGNWDQKNKRWISIASGYDLCSACGESIFNFIMSGEYNNIKIRKVNFVDKRAQTAAEVSVNEDDGK
jgi:hypothetical protein